MDKYYDLEGSILCCFLLKPELMDTTVLEDKHFIKYQRVWKFMKAFYKKFKNFDITLMCSVCKGGKDKYQLVEYIQIILTYEFSPVYFEQYQKQLIDLYDEGQKNKWIIDKVFELSNELLVRNIKVDEFKNKIDEVYNNANKLFDKKED